jgi:hypothetical protein
VVRFFFWFETILLPKLYAARISPPNQFPAFWLGGVASSLDEDEVVPGSFHKTNIYTNHPGFVQQILGKILPFIQDSATPPIPPAVGQEGKVRAGILFPVMLYFTAKVLRSTNFSSWQESLPR